MAAGVTAAGISGREHGSGSKRSFPRRISARCRCHLPPISRWSSIGAALGIKLARLAREAIMADWTPEEQLVA